MSDSPECIERAREVGQCWDCPNRRGLKRLTGNLALRFWGRMVFTGKERIEEQRAGCQGWVPAKIFSTSSGKYVERDGRALTEYDNEDIYFRGCPQTVEAVPEFPDEVLRAMRANDLYGYVHSYASESDNGSIVEFQQKQDELRERFDSFRAARASADQ